MKRKVLFIVIPIVFILVYLFFGNDIASIKQVEYIEPSSTLKGEWFELPSKNREIKSMAFGNEVYVGVGEDLLGYSYDGRQWDFLNEGSISGVINEVIFANGRFVAVGYDRIYTSLNGREWKETEIGADNHLFSIAYGNGKFVSVGSVGVFTSEDGVKWEYHRDSLYWTNLWGICFGDNQFVAVGPYISATSKDGIIWEYKKIPFKKGMGYLHGVAYANGRFIAIGGADDQGSMIWSSKNGLQWKEVFKVRDINFSGNTIDNQFYFTGNHGLLYSKDGEQWNYIQSERSLADVMLVDESLLITGMGSSERDGSSILSAQILIIPQNEISSK
jgi:hypothetical protein